MPVLDQFSTNTQSASVSKVTAPGNKAIAQVYRASKTGQLESVTVNATYSGSSSAPRAHISICTVQNAKPTAIVLGEVTLDGKDARWSHPIAFPASIAQTAGAYYAILVDYPGGKSSESFGWSATSSSDADRKCYVGTGTTWSAQTAVCDFQTSVVEVAHSHSTLGRGPVQATPTPGSGNA